MSRSLTRREFLTLFNPKTTRAVLADPTPALRCRACGTALDPEGNQTLCSICRQAEDKRQSLVDEIFRTEAYQPADRSPRP